MNKVIMLANIARDIELSYTTSGTAIAKFSIAINERTKDKQKSHFFECVAFGQTAENIKNYFNKGSRILIDGKLQQDTWEKDGKKYSKVSIVVNLFDFIDKKTNEDKPKQSYAKVKNKPTDYKQPEVDISDDVPF